MLFILHTDKMNKKRNLFFDKNNEIHRIVEFLVGILEKKYAIGLSKKRHRRDFKSFYKKI